MRLNGWRIGAVLVLVSTVALGGCFLKKSGPPSTPEPIVLLVDNRHWSDVTVSVVHDGVPNRLGVATAASSSQFRLPPHTLGASGAVSFVADPVGSTRVLRSETVVVKPGQYVQWSLERDLRRSTLSVH